MASASRELIAVMYGIAKAAQPITGRGIGYKLFTAGLIGSMSTNDMQKVYRLLRVAREQETIPWSWIVDETRSLERVATWEDPEAYARTVARSYRRDFWDQQPRRVEVWSEKGTIRGVLKPVLDHYAVGFRVMHGFASATAVNDVAEDDDGRDLVVLYVGDFDPSGLFMSVCDLPRRLEQYGGNHVDFRRIALTLEQTNGLPSFPASDKKDDKRFPWFAEHLGLMPEVVKGKPTGVVLNDRDRIVNLRCWEIDAMDPRDLRECVERAIEELIEPIAWARCETVNAAELESLQTILSNWKGR
jgi:hypothetical protein